MIDFTPGVRGLPDVLAMIALAAVVVAAAVTDWRQGKILNAVTYPAIALGLIGQTWAFGLQGLAWALLSFAVGFLPLLAFWLAGGIGGGDAKLMGAVGALSNWRFTLGALLVAFALTAVMAVFVMIRRRIVRRTLGRIWRSVYFSLVPGTKAPSPSGPDSPKIPFGLALCAGTILMLIDTLLGGVVLGRFGSL